MANFGRQGSSREALRYSLATARSGGRVRKALLTLLQSVASDHQPKGREGRKKKKNRLREGYMLLMLQQREKAKGEDTDVLQRWPKFAFPRYTYLALESSLRGNRKDACFAEAGVLLLHLVGVFGLHVCQEGSCR